MFLLSPRFAVLACLCAALPLAFPPPVKAAHLYGNHMTEKHPSASRSLHRSPNASPTHSYDGKHNGHHKAPHRRNPELPPLLRRHDIHDQMNAQDRQGYGPHGHAHPPKGPHSAFARSRYRRESGTHGRRSSVYIPGDHGDKYIVARALPNNRGGNRRKGKMTRTHNRRQVDESNLAIGRIDVMGAAQLANTTQRLASLTVESTPIDWTSGQSTAKAFPLNASATNQTQFIMMPMDVPANAGGSFLKHVTLATEVFDASNAEMVMYCATYDPDPSSTSALLMTPCTGQAQPAASANDAADPCSDAIIDASSSDTHLSQIFSYDPSTGKVEPISSVASSSAIDDSSDDLTGCAGERVRRDASNSTTSSSSTTPSGTSTSKAPTPSASQPARNVTLVYVPGALEVPASSPSASNSASASIGQGPVLTTTITTTVMATVTASSRSVSPAQAAASTLVSSMPSLSTTAATASASASPSPPPSQSSSQPTTTSKTPANANESLQVEVVGVASSTASSSSLNARTQPTTTTTSSYSSVSPTLNPEAVAWSIANQMAQHRAFVTANDRVTPS